MADGNGGPVLVIMGVSGCGKSTVGAMLAGRLGWDFEEGDDLHPAVNVEKMAAGHPLTDDDRWPWLERVAQWIRGHTAAHQPGIVTCSSLKRSYRDVLRSGSDPDRVVFVLLDGTKAQIAERLARRQGHFMPASLLDSQFADLERPGAAENAIVIDTGPPPAVQVGRVVDAVAELGHAQVRS